MGERLKIKLKQGYKSNGDRKVCITTPCDDYNIYFRDIAIICALLARNEQILTKEIEHYVEGSRILKRYMARIFVKDWTAIEPKDIVKAVDLLYDNYMEDRKKVFNET